MANRTANESFIAACSVKKYDERRRLAVKGKALGRKLLAEVAGIVTPETLLAWQPKADCAEVGLQRAAETARTAPGHGRD